MHLLPRLFTSVFASFFLCLLAGSSHAASLSSVDNISFIFGGGQAGQAFSYLVDLAGAPNVSPGGNGTVNLVFPGHPNVITHWSVAGQAAASFGVLHGSMSIAGDGNYAAEAGDSSAAVQPAFFDKVTLTVPGLAVGTVLHLAPSFLLSGSSSNSAAGNLFSEEHSQLTLLVDAVGTQFSALAAGSYQSQTAAFVNGLPFTFDATLLLDAHAAPSQAANALFPALDPFGFAISHDFANTLKFTGFNVTDLQGNAIANYTQSAESGANYLALVPLPATASLFASGLFLLAGWFGRHSREHA